MAVDMFIKIGALKGESRDHDTQGEDRRPGLELGHVATAAPRTSAAARGSGKVNVQDLSFTKYIDKTSH